MPALPRIGQTRSSIRRMRQALPSLNRRSQPLVQLERPPLSMSGPTLLSCPRRCAGVRPESMALKLAKCSCTMTGSNTSTTNGFLLTHIASGVFRITEHKLSHNLCKARSTRPRPRLPASFRSMPRLRPPASRHITMT